MVAKFCSRSHGQPLPGVRSVVMISIRRDISREGVMGAPELAKTDLCMPQDEVSAQRKQVTGFAVSTDWRQRLTVLRAADERSVSIRNSTGAVLRRTGFRHLSRLGPAALCARRNAWLRLWPAPRHRTGMPRPSDRRHEIAARGLGFEARRKPHAGDSDAGHNFRYRADPRCRDRD